MKYPLQSLSSLATNLRIAIETKDPSANELYEQFKRIVDFHLQRVSEGIETGSKEKKPKDILPKCSQTLKEEMDKGNFPVTASAFRITELNLHYYTGSTRVHT